jgi:hypothetical protein
MDIFKWLKNPKKNLPQSIEARLTTLQPLGIVLNAGRTVAEMLESWDREAHERDPMLLFVSLGIEVEVGPARGKQFCDRAWYFDTECVVESGDYVRIIQNLSRLASGELTITNLTDFVDLNAGTAWVAFNVGNEQCRWNAIVDNDWADMSIVTRFATLLESMGSTKRIAAIETGDQNCMLICIHMNDLATLRAISGLDWKWMT